MPEMRKLFLVPFFLIVLAACSGSDDGDEKGEVDETPGSCFYECNLGGLTQFGCATAEDLADEDACYELGRGECGANIGQTALLASCDACAASCAPDWYQG